MGIVPLSRDFLLTHVHLIGGLKGSRMLELGNQQLFCHPDIPHGSSAKPWFTELGVHHTSVDINGCDGALKLDLSKPIHNPDWHCAFDILTDFGTSEHVGPSLKDLFHCRENSHRWTRIGGILLFMNPKTKSWPGHGHHYFTLLHYSRLALATGYEVLELSESEPFGSFRDGWQIHCALRKTSDRFVSLDDYVALCQETIFPS